MLLDQLLTAFVVYDALSGESITMRAFSGKCYQNTKTFEREVRDSFLRIALSYCAGLIEACEQSELGEREQLAPAIGRAWRWPGARVRKRWRSR